MVREYKVPVFKSHYLSDNNLHARAVVCGPMLHGLNCERWMWVWTGL